MIKYIIEILKLQSSLILPGFGSFQVNAKTGKITFNPLLKFNDGTLAKYISQKEGTDQQAAQNQIAKFIREIEAEIGKGNSYDMFQFGKFVKNRKGDVEFIQEGLPIQPTDDTKKAPVKEVKKDEPKKETPKVEIPKVAAAKVETPKVERPKVEVPKVEIPKVAAAKVEIPKVEVPKVESPKVEIPKVAAAKVEIPKVEIPKVEIPKVEIPKVEVPKVEVPKVEIPKVEIPKVEIPKVEVPKVELPKNSFTSSIDSKLSDAKKVEEKIPEISKNIPLADASKKDPAAQEKNKFTPPVVDEKSAIKSSETPKTMAASLKEDSKSKKEEPKKESIKEKFKKDKPQKVKHVEVKEKKKRSRWPRLIIILLILGGGATAAWFYQDDIKSFLYAGVDENHKDSTKTTTTHSHDSLVAENHIIDEEIVNDSTVIEEPVVEEEVVKEPVKKPVKENKVVNHTSSSGSYHIIGNSFSSESNAQNYASTMSGKGYAATVLGKFNGLYLVSLKSYPSREEAKSGLSSVSADASSAWVFKH